MKIVKEDSKFEHFGYFYSPFTISSLSSKCPRCESVSSAVNTPSAKSTITVDQAVQIVKDNFSIPEKYSQLSRGINEFNNQCHYSLNWNAIEQPGGSFNAEVDATTGDILSVNQWDQSLNPTLKLPVLSAGEAEKIATDLIAKLASKHQSEMQLMKDDQQLFTLNTWSTFYVQFPLDSYRKRDYIP